MVVLKLFFSLSPLPKSKPNPSQTQIFPSSPNSYQICSLAPDSSSSFAAIFAIILGEKFFISFCPFSFDSA
ncbi:hypothetical protein GIB67_039778 [Kingdonia uniflora]|uniref:Uncharacterized protein n=1 Tax=Kingdonia uniflora TaxID=39325 RepID=A0A7J7MQB4_9MAGN|nr:hypothetical protein GIB67_039778 [Kingdonia uniflora]